jgi:ATP-dependent protease Clp ATPase subunit
LTQGKIRDFASYGITLRFEEQALAEIARRASSEGTGARGLKSILERRLLPLEHALPGRSIAEVVVDRDTILDPKPVLGKLLSEGGLVHFVIRFRERTGIRLAFTPQARQWIVERAAERETDVRQLCEEMFTEFEYGLQLTGKRSIRIGVKACRDPRGFLDTLIKKAYVEKEKKERSRREES